MILQHQRRADRIGGERDHRRGTNKFRRKRNTGMVDIRFNNARLLESRENREISGEPYAYPLAWKKKRQADGNGEEEGQIETQI